MSEPKEPMLEAEHEEMFELFSRTVNIRRPNVDGFAYRPILGNNLDRVAIGRKLAKVYRIAVADFVANEGDSVFARNQAASRVLKYFEKVYRIAPGTARQLMRIAERFGNDDKVLQTFSWSELVLLLSHDDAVVREAMGHKGTYPKITGADFSKLIKCLRSNAIDSDAQSQEEPA